MKKIILGFLGTVLLSGNAFALPNNIQLDYKMTGKTSSSENSIYYSNNKIKLVNLKNQLFNNKPILLGKAPFYTNIYDSEKNEIYISMDSEKSFHLYKKASSNKVTIFDIANYQLRFNVLNEIKELEKGLTEKGFKKNADETIKLLGKDFDCNVFELTLGNQFKSKDGKSHSYTTKVWISKYLGVPVKEYGIRDDGLVPVTKELTGIKEDIKFDDNFFKPTKSIKIELEKESYDSIIKN